MELNEVFQDYKDNFKGETISNSVIKEYFKKSNYYRTDLKENSNEYKKAWSEFLNSAEYKEKESAEIEKQFIKYVKEIETDKLTTFIQVYNNEVILLQSPPDKIDGKSNKDGVVQFLGYDWSNKRGNEGIKYITDTTTESEGDEDTEFLEAINSIKNIRTPLYNPNDSYDCSKFSYAIRKHITKTCQKFPFNKNMEHLEHNFNNNLPELLCYEDLSNLIDFSLASFDKKIRTKPVELTELKSKYTIVKLGKIAQSWSKGQPLQKDDLKESGKHPCIHYGELYSYKAIIEKIKSKTDITPKKKSEKGDILFPASDVTTDGLARCSVISINDVLLGSDIIVLRPKKLYEDIKINSDFLSFAINQQREQLLAVATGSNVKHLSSTSLKNIKIPLPPNNIQEKIVKECKKILNEFNTTRMDVEVYRNKITNTFKKNKVVD